jgi:hypothetical protein
MLTKNDLINIHRLMLSDKVSYTGQELVVTLQIIQRLEAQISSMKDTDGDAPNAP